MNISVVVTTFNRTRLLKEALEGIQSQEFKPIQVIVIDDGSDCDYTDILNQFVDLPITYKKLDLHSGANCARNAGISMCNADIIAFLDDDDIWYPNYLQEIHQAFENGADAVVTGYQRLERGDIHINDSKFVSKNDLMVGNPYCGTSGFSGKREILESTLFDETLYNGQDWDMYIRLVQNNIVITNLTKPLYFYREASFLSISKMQLAMKPEHINTRFRSAEKHRKFIGERNFKLRIGNQILMHLLQKREKRRWLKKAVDEVGVFITIEILLKSVIRVLARKLRPTY